MCGAQQGDDPMRICVVSVDVEEDLDGEKSFRGVENLNRILEVFERFDIEATLFVTGEVLEKYQDLVVRWATKHEIACHGYYHTPLYELAMSEREKQLDDFWGLCKRTLGQEPKGFRAVQHTIDDTQLKLLEKRGFLYDSSVISNYVPLMRYVGYKGKAPAEPYSPSCRSYRDKGNMSILEIPVVPLAFGIPLTGSWIRMFGPKFYRMLLLVKKPPLLSFTMHSWDCVELTSRYSRNTGTGFVEMLSDLLGRIETSYTFVSAYRLLQGIGGHDNI